MNNLKRTIPIYFTIHVYMFENNVLFFVVRMIHLFFGNQILYLEKESAIYVLVIDFNYFYFEFFYFNYLIREYFIKDTFEYHLDGLLQLQILFFVDKR